MQWQIRDATRSRVEKLPPRLAWADIVCMIVWLLRHGFAGFGAGGADICALLHPFNSLATLCAFLAHDGAHSTGEVMEFGTADHEVCRCLTNLGTIHHQPDVRSVSMLSSFL